MRSKGSASRESPKRTAAVLSLGWLRILKSPERAHVALDSRELIFFPTLSLTKNVFFVLSNFPRIAFDIGNNPFELNCVIDGLKFRMQTKSQSPRMSCAMSDVKSIGYSLIQFNLPF